MLSGVKVSYRQTQAERVHIHIIASEQTNANEAIVQAVADATRAAIQAMAMTRAERTQNAGPRLGRPMMKHPHSTGKQKKCTMNSKPFRLEVNNIFKPYSTP